MYRYLIYILIFLTVSRRLEQRDYEFDVMERIPTEYYRTKSYGEDQYKGIVFYYSEENQSNVNLWELVSILILPSTFTGLTKYEKREKLNQFYESFFEKRRTYFVESMYFELPTNTKK